MTTTETTEATTKPSTAETKRAKKATAKARKTRKGAKKDQPVMYTSTTPTGLLAVGSHVRYNGTGRSIKNDWLKKGMVGRVFGYRPGRKGGGLYAVRFEGGTTLLSVKRVQKVGKGRAT